MYIVGLTSALDSLLWSLDIKYLGEDVLRPSFAAPPGGRVTAAPPGYATVA